MNRTDKHEAPLADEAIDKYCEPNHPDPIEIEIGRIAIILPHCDVVYFTDDVPENYGGSDSE